ncbi:MAG: LysM peptidoglycan-binding domain-containing protein [Pirellulales bacterium]
MGTIVRGVRFIVGLLMVGLGVSMAVPLARVATHHWSAASAAGGGMPTTVASPVETAIVPPPAPTQQWMVPEDALPPAVELRSDYVPPPPPDRLPPAAAVFVADGSNMNGTYRSTLEVPPPPLLDTQSAPPAMTAWAATETPRPAVPAAMAIAEPLPATYVVRDGDDLTSIAARLYGHPGAAAAVWNANRDVIPDPNLLPIGGHLRLPPPWTVQGIPTSPVAGGRSIEPPVGPAFLAGATGPRTTATGVGGPQAVPAGWLEGRQSSPAADVRSAPRGGVVRLGPGETLESLAIKFYGDRSAAARIWEANRDRLRSPELVVAGMELRLP